MDKRNFQKLVQSVREMKLIEKGKMKPARVTEIDLLDERSMTPSVRMAYQIEYAKGLLIQKLADLRDKSKLNQKQLAGRLGVSQQAVSRIETGDNENLTIETLLRLARAMGQKVRISFHKAAKNELPLEIF